MYCLKCGCETRPDNVFCDHCLADMATCPVRADAVIHLPDRPALAVERSPRKKKKAYADYVRSLRRLIRCLCWVVAVLVLLVGVLGYLLYQELDNSADIPAIGKNYTTTETQD